MDKSPTKSSEKLKVDQNPEDLMSCTGELEISAVSG